MRVMRVILSVMSLLYIMELLRHYAHLFWQSIARKACPLPYQQKQTLAKLTLNQCIQKNYQKGCVNIFFMCVLPVHLFLFLNAKLVYLQMLCDSIRK